MRVAIDGVDGAGKTVFADALAAAMAGGMRPPVRASVDAFHRPRAARYRLGRDSPEGFYRDSYDYAALRRCLLDPFGPDGDGVHCLAAFDHVADAAVPPVWHKAPPRAALVLDGIFLHRPGLAGMWDVSVWLEVPFAVSVPRGAARGPGFGDPDPAHPANRRYVEGQKLYLREAAPAAVATLVVDNSDLAAPRLLDRRAAIGPRVREARPADWPEVQALRLSVRENRLSDPSRVTEAMYLDYIERRGRGWVAEAGGRIEGFCIAALDGEVWALFVRPDGEGRGVGLALMRACVAWLEGEGVAEARLETGAGTRAEGFYRRFGWIEAGRHGGDIAFRLPLRAG